MRAIIIPLNEFFYNHDKYDGTTPPERFFNRRPIFKKYFLETKVGEAILVYPFAFAVLAFYVAPFFTWHYLKSGYAIANSKCHVVAGKFEKALKKFQSKNIFPTIQIFQRKGYSLIVYYTSDMIPRKTKKRKIFFEKMELMKAKLKIAHIIEANSREDIEKAILSFNINVSESFFMTDGRIDLSDYRQIPEMVDFQI
jgi:hypothetical protein